MIDNHILDNIGLTKSCGMPSLQTELFTPAWTILKTAGYQQNNYDRTRPTESKMILRTENVKKISFKEDTITGR